MYDFDMSQPPQTTTGEKKEFAPLETGEYNGVIEKTEVKTSQKGEKYINVQLRLDNKRVVFDRLSFEAQNPTAKKIAHEKFQSICFFGIEKPQAKFKSLDEMASYIAKTPVKIYYSNKGKDETGRFDRFNISYKNGITKTTKSQPTTSKASIY